MRQIRTEYGLPSISIIVMTAWSLSAGTITLEAVELSIAENVIVNNNVTLQDGHKNNIVLENIVSYR